MGNSLYISTTESGSGKALVAIGTIELITVVVTAIHSQCQCQKMGVNYQPQGQDQHCCCLAKVKNNTLRHLHRSHRRDRKGRGSANRQFGRRVD
jgi:hypothetical protein